MADNNQEFGSFIKAPNFYGDNGSNMSLNMLSFFSQSSNSNTPNERQRANSEKLRMMSNIKISYHEMIQKARDLSNSNNGSAKRTPHGDENASSVYDFNGATNLVLKKATLNYKETKSNYVNPLFNPQGNQEIRLHNMAQKQSEMQVIQQQKTDDMRMNNLRSRQKQTYSNIMLNREGAQNLNDSEKMNNKNIPATVNMVPHN